MRLLRDCVNAKRTQLQCYMDNPYFLLRETKTARDNILSFLCLHTATVGITMAWHKAVRGPDLEWIGALSQPRLTKRAILMTINEKIAKETLAESQKLLKKSIIPFSGSEDSRAAWLGPRGWCPAPAGQ